MNSAIQNELDHITAAIKANTTPDSIYLFGSYANGTYNNDSDIDTVLLLKEMRPQPPSMAAGVEF